MRSQQELSDRLDIQDLITAYSYAIDFHEWNGLDDIFTADATLDFTATGGESGDLPAMKDWLARTLTRFAGHQHLVATSAVALDGDRASARSLCHNPMYLDVDGHQQVLFVGLWYEDDLVRTPLGWRIRSRRQRIGYMHGLPAAR
jgi:SnoaL-like protein